jgi:hypothetical protein
MPLQHSGAAPGRHASPFGSVVTGSRELNELPDFPRDYPPRTTLLGAMHGEGFPDMSRFALLLAEQEASFTYPTRNFATLGRL